MPIIRLIDIPDLGCGFIVLCECVMWPNSEVSRALPFTGWVRRGSLVTLETIALFSREVKRVPLRLTVQCDTVLSRARWVASVAASATEVAKPEEVA